MGKAMTHRQRIVSALRGGRADHIPLTVYPEDIPKGETERKLRNKGLGFIKRVSLYRSYMKDVEICSKQFKEGEITCIAYTLRTPLGELHQVVRTGGGFGSSLRSQFYIKNPEDYKIMEFVVQHTFYEPNYEAFLETEKDMGEDGYVAGNLGYTPVQDMIINMMGPEGYAVGIYEYPELMDSLNETMLTKRREWYRIAAESPAEVIWYGDNVTSDMIGLERFQKYCVSCYNELASFIHPRGKLLAVHMDGRLDHLKQAIAESKVDIIEAFTPPPDGDLSVLEARKVWKNKVLWINFPTSFHSKSTEEIEAYTLDLLHQAVPGDRFLISNTENLTPGVWQNCLNTVADVLQKSGCLPLAE